MPMSDITLQYQVDQSLPPVKLLNDSAVKFYVKLKKRDSTLTRFPLRITKNVDSMCEHHVSTSINQDSVTNWCNRKHYKYTSTMKTKLFYYDFMLTITHMVKFLKTIHDFIFHTFSSYF